MNLKPHIKSTIEAKLRAPCLASMLMLVSLSAAAAECKLERYGELPVTMRGTAPLVTATINGTQVSLLADSGAFFNTLTPATAEMLKLKSAPLPMNMTIRGVGGRANAHLGIAKDFSLAGVLGNRVFHDIEFVVTEISTVNSGISGVIGQNVLGSADTEYDLANGFIRLFQAKDCNGKTLAYWHGDSAVGVIDIQERTPLNPQLIGKATLNGKKIRVMFDSGASHSVLTLEAAAHAGIKADSDNVSATGISTGIGKRTSEVSTARFDELDLGGEKIKNARLMLGDISINIDMLLGADFFLSHRIYVAAKQRKLYFTYNGGTVFDLGARQREIKQLSANANTVTTATGDSSPAAEPASAEPASQARDANMDAAAFRGRGAASAGRREFQTAIADFDQAIKLDPNDAENYYQRALAKMQLRQGRQALADYDAALKLKPEHVGALTDRGTLRLAMNNQFGAQADFDEVLKLQANDPLAGLRIAQIYVSTRHFNAAIERLDQWISTHPKDGNLPTALNSRCYSRVLMGKEYELALADCNAALKLGPRSSLVLDNRGLAWLRLGNADKALLDFKDSLKLQPKNPLTLYGLGLAEIKKGAQAEGDKNIQAAVAIAPAIAEFFKRFNFI